MKSRRIARQIQVGRVKVGGFAPVSVQSMTNTDTRDVDATVAQIRRLEQAGCEIVRLAVPDEEAAACLGRIKRQVSLPLVADIHFSHKLALRALEAGADCIRINPGNIGARWKVEEVTRACAERGVPIRIGVNGGSLEREVVEAHGGATAEAMVASGLGHIRILEDLGFDQIKISLKASDVERTVEAYRLMAQQVDYPLHLGVTEAGPPASGAVKSAVALGSLLLDGIGDTIRISLAADPVEEVRVAYEILKACGLRRRGVNLIACPSCGRAEIDLVGLATEVERRLGPLAASVSVAVMGCVVNGPGEASDADYGVAGGRGFGLLFKGGEVVGRVEEARLVDALVELIEADHGPVGG
ncbi:MAG: flavodoxin-dependent (E)-4-hydroxy-3-methylbut-2-enyl-diphosphate synthase [Nitrospirae bacterium]|nr:MAG: flavodoxin-dependent (E)-4-hydroxy-3-methylbut-2-enyl-diphosphate synthase [Nitrospirota bacterium]